MMRDGLVEGGDLAEWLMEGKKERFAPILTYDFLG
jgi:hypothetical protein